MRPMSPAFVLGYTVGRFVSPRTLGTALRVMSRFRRGPRVPEVMSAEEGDLLAVIMTERQRRVLCSRCCEIAAVAGALGACSEGLYLRERVEDLGTRVRELEEFVGRIVGGS